ncbi:peptidoglycan-binding domain-containing protein [Faunimonas sp. B44]|uniref:peptidoglycan-binding domain-containing protein n=1 Tax=Faunimonas sp. B44 TaxID=3461493 RepID=UPI004043EEE4
MAGTTALVCVLVAANALYGQTAMHPAPFFATRSAQAENHVAHAAPETIQAVQLALLQGGFYDGPLDGRNGPKTRRAVEEFERGAGLAVTGEPSEALLSVLVGSHAPETPSSRPVSPAREVAAEPMRAAAPDNPAVLTTSPDPMILAVQRALALSAYGPLVPDGVVGPQTREAISRFQLDQGLPVTGSIDDALIARLRSIGAMGGA